jgi:hypothetical protein
MNRTKLPAVPPHRTEPPVATSIPAAIEPAEVEQRLAVLEARQDDLLDRVAAQDTAYGRFEGLLAVFAVLITLLVIYAAWKTERSAIKAATDAAKDEIKGSLAEVEECVGRAKSAADKSEEVLLEIEGHKKVAASDARAIRANRESVLKTGSDNPVKQEKQS